MPILLWDKVHSTQNLRYLYLDSLRHIHRKPPTSWIEIYALTMIWKNIYNEYLSVFGFHENYLLCIAKRKEIARLRLKLILTGDQSIRTFIKVCEHELAELEKDEMPSDLLTIKANIENAIGIRINPMECSIREFYGYVKFIKENSKRIKDG